MTNYFFLVFSFKIDLIVWKHDIESAFKSVLESFKIDLIVWKPNTADNLDKIIGMFKIDLIVWKLAVVL